MLKVDWWKILMPFSLIPDRSIRYCVSPHLSASNGTGSRRVELRSTCGFSLLELLTVMAIAGALSVMAIPLGKKFIDQINLKITSDSIKNQLSIAKMRAISDPNIPCGVYFDIDSSPQKAIIFIDQPGGRPYLYDEGIDTRHLNEVIIPKGITLKIPEVAPIQNNSIVFRADGSVKTGGNILLTDNYGKARRINVLPSTGRVRIFQD